MSGDVTWKVNTNWKSPGSAVNRGIMAFMERKGKSAVEIAQGLAPDATGTLKDSIFYFVNNRAPNGQFMGPELMFGAKAPYAVYVEMGHATRNGGFVEAQPFLRPAILQTGGSL